MGKKTDGWVQREQVNLGGGFKDFFYFYPYLGKSSNGLKLVGFEDSWSWTPKIKKERTSHKNS